MKSRTNLHDQSPSFVNNVHRVSSRLPKKAETKSLKAEKINRRERLNFHRDEEIFRIEREFSQEMPYSSLLYFDMPK